MVKQIAADEKALFFSQAYFMQGFFLHYRAQFAVPVV